MFEKKSGYTQEPKEPLLMKKKTLFLESIRRQQRCQIISQLRQRANFPLDLTNLLKNLPENINHLEQIIQQSAQWPSSWHKIVVTRLQSILQTHHNIIFSTSNPPNIQIYLLVYVISFTEVTSEQFKQYWTKVRQNSKNWTIQQRTKLLQLLALATKKIDVSYLKEAESLIESCESKIVQRLLDFYNFVVKCYPKEGFSLKLLNNKLCQKIIKSFGLYFYSSNEKKKMCEILIQILYQSERQTVSSDWDLLSLFDALQMAIEYSQDNKMLIQRALFLIYNVNIDASSKIFLCHPCVEVLYLEIQNQEFPFKLRELMAQVYLSAVFNLLPSDMPKYMKNHFGFFSKLFTMILEEFQERQQLMKKASELLKLMLQVQNLNDKFKFKSYVIQNHELMEVINRSVFCQEISFDQNLHDK